MNTLNIPGFTADTSLYKTNGHYVTRGHTPALTGEIYPALQPRIGGGLNAWGCWEARCCVVGLCQDGPGGSTYWCCKYYEPCTRCIWPW
jgi:hypothetical protein